MPASSLASIITALATLVTAIGGVIAVFRVLLPQRRETSSIHKIVNQQRTDMLRFQRALVDALVEHGIKVPIDQSLPLPEEVRQP